MGIEMEIVGLSENMKGKICLVTGATNGIGKVTAQTLAQMGATVIIVGRNAEKCAVVVSEIQQASGNKAVEALVADLSVMAEVRRLAEQFKAKYSKLDVLINNAGAFYWSRQVTSDGLEMTFALNHLSYFLLTNLLLDTLKASAPARIVNVASNAHQGAHLDFDDLQSEKKYSGSVYGRSKLANIIFTYELARRLSGTGVTANALHPGFVRTGFGRNMGVVLNSIFSLFARLVALTPEQGAQTSIYLASSPEVENITGKYFDKCKAVASSHESYDQSSWTRLWEVSEKLSAVKT